MSKRELKLMPGCLRVTNDGCSDARHPDNCLELTVREAALTRKGDYSHWEPGDTVFVPSIIFSTHGGHEMVIRDTDVVAYMKAEKGSN